MITDPQKLSQNYKCKALICQLKKNTKTEPEIRITNSTILPPWIKELKATIINGGKQNSFETTKSKYDPLTNTISAVFVFARPLKDVEISTYVHEFQHAKDFWLNGGRLEVSYCDGSKPTMENGEIPFTNLLKYSDGFNLNKFDEEDINRQICLVFSKTHYWLDSLEENAVMSSTLFTECYNKPVDENLFCNFNISSNKDEADSFADKVFHIDDKNNHQMYFRSKSVGLITEILRNIDNKIELSDIVNFIKEYDVDSHLFKEKNYEYNVDGVKKRLENIRERLYCYINRVCEEIIKTESCHNE